MQAHEDFIITAGEAYFLSFVMQHFSMNEMDDTPVHLSIPKNIGFLHQKRRQDVFDKVMDEVVAELFIPFEEQVSIYSSTPTTFPYLYIYQKIVVPPDT
jgi:hypothetical protein